jgi:Pyridoxamine 5'-phosphate oxidase
MIWADFQAAAPDLAHRGGECFERTGVAMLGTLCRDGSPRISPVEPFFAGGHLLLGVMARSAKARDLLRDPRCALHSAVTAPDAGEAELKLYGRAQEVRDEAVRSSCPDAWWTAHPPEAARVMSLDIVRAVLVSWNFQAGEMTVTRWTAARGLSELTRRYP